MTDQTFIFALHADGDGPPEALRVRRLLKELGRRHRLKVTWPDRGELAGASEAHERSEPKPTAPAKR